GVVNTSAGTFVAIAPTALPVNTWVHVAMTLGDGVLRVFQSGVIVASTSASGNIVNHATIATIGNDNNANTNAGWSGRIDELTVYARMADPLEVKAIYDADGAGKANQMGNNAHGIEIASAVGTIIGGPTGSTAPGTAPGNVIAGSRNGTGIY